MTAQEVMEMWDNNSTLIFVDKRGSKIRLVGASAIWVATNKQIPLMEFYWREWELFVEWVEVDPATALINFLDGKPVRRFRGDGTTEIYEKGDTMRLDVQSKEHTWYIKRRV